MNPTHLRKQFLGSVLKALEVRFPDGNQTSNPMVKESLITSFSNWPTARSENISGLHTVQLSYSVPLQFFLNFAATSAKVCMLLLLLFLLFFFQISYFSPKKRYNIY